MADQTFTIQVIIDGGKAKPVIKGVKGELEGAETAANNLGGALKKAFALAVIIKGVKAVTSLSDAYTITQNKLKIVTDGTAELTAAQTALFEIADRTRTEYEATAEVYSRVGLAASELGRSQEELLNFTESLNQAVQLSGATSSEAAGGLRQLSQGIASGTLRGDELISVLESLPVVADVIAKSLGVTRGELRALGADGKISSEIILDSFKEAREELAGRFAETVPTLAQSFVVLRNNVLGYVGAADQSFGASATVAATMAIAAENVDLLAGGVLVLAVGLGSVYVPAALAASGATGKLLLKLKAAAGFLAANPFFAVAAAAITAAGIATSFWADELIKAEDALSKAAAAGNKFALTDYAKVGDDIIRVQENLRIVQENIDRDLTTKGFANPAAIAIAERYRKDLENLGFQQDALADGTASSTVQARQQLEALNALNTAVDDSVMAIGVQNGLLALNSREREVQISLLEQVAKLEKGTDAEVTDDQKTALKLALEENQLLQERAEVLERIKGPQQDFKADLAALNALREQGSISQTEFTDELSDMASALEDADFNALNLDDFLAGVEGIDVDKIRGLLESLREAGNGQDAFAVGDTDVPLSAQMELQLDLLERIQGPQQAFVQVQAALNELLQQGAISAEEYAIALNEAEVATNTISTSASQGFSAGLAQIENQILDVSGTAQNALVNSFNSANEALVDFAKTGELSFDGLIDTIIDGLARLAVQNLLGLLTGAGGGEGAGFAGALGSLFGGGKASGGDVNPNQAFLVGEGGPELFTPPNAGTITPAGETAARLGAAAAAPVVNVAPANIQVTNVTNPQDILDEIDSPEGTQKIMNVISRKRRAVKGITG